MQTYYYSFIILLCRKWILFQNIRKIIVFVKHCLTSKIRIKHVIICYKNLYTAYLLNWSVFLRNLNKVWKSLCFGIQIYFKCVLIFENSQSNYVLGPANGDYTLVPKLVSFWGLPPTYVWFLGLVTRIMWP